MTDLIKIGILGADGRMGLAVAAAVKEQARATLTAALTAPDSPHLGQAVDGHDIVYASDINAALQSCDVLIDFSAPRATLAAVEILPSSACKAIVSGTTGMDEVQEAQLRNAAESLTILRSGNFSLGVNLLEVLVEQATRALRTGWDVEVLEMHHRHKVDAPSGTGLMLGEAAARGRDVNLSDVQVSARHGDTGPRKEGNIGFGVLRGGGVIGTHEVRIASELEMITLAHDAFDRSVFAQGAVAAAFWAVDQPHGYYSMRDMLGL